MSLSESFENSEVCDYYKDKSIFITGATGFIGKALIEKLLRSSYDLKKIYLLVRSKKGHNPNQRLNELVNCKLFDVVNKTYPNFKEKLVAINGDLLEPNLGISEEDEKTLIENVNIVFHSAATVRFDEPLKLAVDMNIRGVKKMIDLTRKIKKLEVFVHVSTAYANCERQHVTEIVYNPPISPEKILEACDWMEEDLINLLTPKIIKQRPNTYTFTKAIAESLVLSFDKEFPVTIVRPSIVGASWREPFSGWIENLNGPTAVFIAAGKGLLKSMLAKKNALADILPVDICVNFLIVAGWYRGAEKTNKTIVYNCTTGATNPLRWAIIENSINTVTPKYPLENVFLYPGGSFTSSVYIKEINTFIKQIIPAFIMDCVFRIMNKKPFLIKIQKKLRKGVHTLEFFTSRQWEFTNDNFYMLMSKMSENDLKYFNIDVKGLHWPTYLEQYIIGCKKFVLKEDVTKYNKCRSELARLKRNQNIVKYVSLFLIFKFILLRKYSFRQVFQFIFEFALKISKFLANSSRRIGQTLKLL